MLLLSMGIGVSTATLCVSWGVVAVHLPSVGLNIVSSISSAVVGSAIDAIAMLGTSILVTAADIAVVIATGGCDTTRGGGGR